MSLNCSRCGRLIGHNERVRTIEQNSSTWDAHDNSYVNGIGPVLATICCTCWPDKSKDSENYAFVLEVIRLLVK